MDEINPLNDGQEMNDDDRDVRCRPSSITGWPTGFMMAPMANLLRRRSRRPSSSSSLISSTCVVPRSTCTSARRDRGMIDSASYSSGVHLPTKHIHIQVHVHVHRDSVSIVFSPSDHHDIFSRWISSSSMFIHVRSLPACCWLGTYIGDSSTLPCLALPVLCWPFLPSRASPAGLLYRW